MDAWLEERIISLYVLVDDFVKHAGPRRLDVQKMSDAEVLTTALFSAWFCHGKTESARRLLGQSRYIPSMLSKSRLCRRIHELSSLLPALCHFLSKLGLNQNPEGTFLVDTFPIPVCQNIRINRCKIYQQEVFRGYTSSKRTYFYGLKLLLITTKQGYFTQLALAPGSTGDMKMLNSLALDLPRGSELIRDKAFTDYAFEELLADAACVRLLPLRKSNSKRPHPPGENLRLQKLRKPIETVGSQLNAFFPKKIHAVTARGFELKIIFFVLALAVSAIFF